MLIAMGGANRDQSQEATAVVQFGPGEPVRFRRENRVVREVVSVEGPVPVAALVRRVLERYGLEPAGESSVSLRETEFISRSEMPTIKRDVDPADACGVIPRTDRECPGPAARRD